MSGLKTLVDGQVWSIDNFLSEKDFTYLEKTYVNADIHMLHVDNKNMRPLMADTDMSYRVVSMKIYNPIFNSIEKHLDITLPKPKSKMAMQYKRFLGNDSYALHAEDKSIYGEYAYIMYLTDETDGELILPSRADAAKESTDGFEEMKNTFDVTFADETMSYIPKKNTCLIMRTGIAHSVRSCTGRRDSIAGWPGFIPAIDR